MPNDFSKEVKVAFDQIMEGFDDECVLSNNVEVYQTDQVMMERTSDVIWLPQPNIATSYDGTDQTANFKAQTNLSVPASIDREKSVPWTFTPTELRDALQNDIIVKSAKQRLSSDIDKAVRDVASTFGSVVVKRTVAATGYDDVALCDAAFSEQGVPMFDLYMGLGPRDYNAMAGNLAARQTMAGKPITAYEKAYVGRVAGFDTYKMGIASRLAAASGGAGITMSTLDGGGNFYTPVAKRTATTGERSNVDNRFQTITVSTTASVRAGDCFTIAALNAVHHISKDDTGQLKTFRVVSIDSGTTMTITPPMITNQVASDAGSQYQNCVINTKAANSALVFLNTVAAPVNCFWHKGAIKLLPGRYAVPANAGASIMRATTKQGIEVTMQEQYDIKTMTTFLRVDTRFGVAPLNTEMMGIMIFNQT